MPPPIAGVARARGPWSGRLVLAAVATGVAAGVGGVLLTLLLHLVQHLGFGYTEDTFLIGGQRASVPGGGRCGGGRRRWCRSTARWPTRCCRCLSGSARPMPGCRSWGSAAE